MVRISRRNFGIAAGAVTIDAILELNGVGLFTGLGRLLSTSINPEDTPELPPPISNTVDDKPNPELEHLVVIGCSAFGKGGIEYLVPKLNLNSSAVVIYSHVQIEEIYDSLDSLGVNVAKVKPDKNFKQGTVYVADKEYNYLKIKTMDIDSAMESAAENYGDRCIGVILNGTGYDGSKGVQYIKEHEGRVLVQLSSSLPDTIWAFSKWAMPVWAKAATEVDFAGPLPELVPILNEYLTK